MRLKLLLIVLFALLLPVTTFAQTSTTDNPVVGISVEYPEEWASKTIPVAEGVNTIYLADSDDTLEQILTEPTLPMLSGQMTIIHYPPDVVSQMASDVVEVQAFFPDVEWIEISVNDRLAYKWDYEDERTQGFIVLYELSDGRVNFSVADTAIGELTEEIDAMFMEIIASVEPYSLASAIEEGLEFSETAVSDKLSFVFQYPIGWYVSEVEEIDTGLILSASTSGTSFGAFSGQPLILLTEVPLDALGIDENLKLETGNMSMAILESYAEAAAEGGQVFTTVELLDIEGVPVGRVAAKDSPTIYMLVLNEDLIVQIWVSANDGDLKEALETVVVELIATISTDIPESLSSLAELLDTVSELNATHVMENGIAFDYPEGWSIIEDSNLVLMSNVKNIEDFTAQKGDVLLIVSAEPTEDANIADVLTKLRDMFAAVSEAGDVDINIFRFDDSETTSDISFDLGEPAVDWNIHGGVILNAERTLQGAIVMIVNQQDYNEALAVEIFQPILDSFRLNDEE